jgi:hypothetical protein
MRYALLAVKLLIFGYLAYLLYILAAAYEPQSTIHRPPFVIFILDTINLFIHEAGHFFLRPFGMFIYILGGSLVQCTLPFALLLVTWRQNVTQLVYPGFWLGENLVNVSMYIKDAPYKQLHLLARGLIHDWNWLLADNLDAAEPIGEIVFVLGLLICFASIGAGVFYAVRRFREPIMEAPD